MWRSEKVSGFAFGLRETSGEYSWIWRANPWDYAEPGVAAVLLGREPQRAVLPVRIDDDARHAMAQELLDEDAEQVALPAARLREDAHVALDELVDVELDAQRVVAEQTDVGPAVRVVLQAEDLGDERFLRPIHERPRPERDRRDLHDPLAVAVADDAGDPEEVLVDRGLLGRTEVAGVLEIEVALPLEIVELAEDLPVVLVLHGEVVAALDGGRERELELPEPDVAEDAAYGLHGAFYPGGPLLA